MVTSLPRRPRRADVAVAAGCWVVVFGVLLALPFFVSVGDSPSTALVSVGSAAWWWCLLTVTAQATALAFVRTAPRVVLILVAAVPLALALMGIGEAFSLTSAAITVAVFVATIRHPLRSVRLGLVAAAVLLLAGELVNGVAGGRLGFGLALGSALLQVLGAIATPLVVALAVVGRRDTRLAQRQELAAMAREQQALVRVAVANERTAMARELHDIAAHHLSGIALMAAAVDRQIDTDAETAKRSVRQIRAQSTAVLEDLRRLVGLMREEGDAPRSVETLAAIAELVDQRRAGGAPVELRVLEADGGGELGEGIGPLAQLAVYRIVQESLTNAATHAPDGATVVEVDDRGADALTVSITNAAARPVTTGRQGFGLVGMRERAELVGATLHYGATTDGGWQVRVEMPRDDSRRPDPPSPTTREEIP